jgi:hypothetical protein
MHCPAIHCTIVSIVNRLFLGDTYQCHRSEHHIVLMKTVNKTHFLYVKGATNIPSNIPDHPKPHIQPRNYRDEGSDGDGESRPKDGRSLALIRADWCVRQCVHIRQWRVDLLHKSKTPSLRISGLLVYNRCPERICTVHTLDPGVELV